MDRIKLSELVKQNRVDGRALDALDTLQCTYDIAEDLQHEVLKLKDKLDAPDGTFGTICKLTSDMREQAEALFLAYYEGMDPHDFTSLSDEVRSLLVREYLLVYKAHNKA